MDKHNNINFSNREIEILNLISFGHTVYDIASQLYISHHTVKSYKKRLFERLDVSNCALLVRKGFEQGLLV